MTYFDISDILKWLYLRSNTCLFLEFMLVPVLHAPVSAWLDNKVLTVLSTTSQPGHCPQTPEGR